MLTKRIIPCLDVRNGRVTKGVKFRTTSPWAIRWKWRPLTAPTDAMNWCFTTSPPPPKPADRPGHGPVSRARHPDSVCRRRRRRRGRYGSRAASRRGKFPSTRWRCAAPGSAEGARAPSARNASCWADPRQRAHRRPAVSPAAMKSPSAAAASARAGYLGMG